MSRREGAKASFWASDAGVRWRASVLLGLLSSSYSTLISQLLAARIGRDAVVDWMVVAAIPGRDGMLQTEPSWPVIVTGILFHQWADFSWEVLFFGLLGRWTGRLGPWTLLIVVAPTWAVLTSATEWFFLVPIFPFRQPIFPLEQPYWIGFLVHFASASMYPMFPFLRDWMRRRSPSPNRRFAGGYASALGIVAAVCGTLAFLGDRDREWLWQGRDPATDQAYIRRMSAHHAQGVEIADIAASKAADPHLRALARLFSAEQTGERKILAQWSLSWFDQPPQVCGAAERATMPGMLSDAEMASLRAAQGGAFDRLFVELMSHHHSGAVLMADAETRDPDADPRLRIMAEATRHGQQGEIEMMRGVGGAAAVENAFLDMFSARILVGRPD